MHGISATHALDIIGSVFSFFSTLFYVLAMEVCWPLGIIATVLNSILYGLSGIYGDMSLEVIYFFFMLYGWYEWRYGGKTHKGLKISHASLSTLMKLGVFAVFGILVTYTSLKFYLHSTVPSMDSITTVLSLIAQWMICMKMIETWILWFIVDGIYVVLYFDKSLPAHSVLLVIYVGMAIVGYWRWHQLLRKQNGSNHNSG